MNIKKSVFASIFILLFASISLSSCGFLLFDHDDEPYVPLPSEDESIPENANYYRADRSTNTYYDLGQHNIFGQRYTRSLGKSKTLVVPIKIKGYESVATQNNREKIEKAFFGTSDDTGWESVSSFFYRSSFGQFDLEGVVTDWFDCGLTPYEIVEMEKAKFGDGGTYYLLDKIYTWLGNNGYIFSDYDLDKDGYIDSIWMIYGCPNYTNTSFYIPEDFWAFSFIDYDFLDRADKDIPVPHTYAWASYDFMNVGKGARINIDSHTYIHETGHILGLTDYYDYDGLHSPMGKVDMQDHNVGDHNAYSKMALGWSRPYVVEGDCTIKIKPAESMGHCILISDPKKPYNGNAFSEYLLLELITPTGLWKQDSTTAYPTFNSKTYTKPGVRLMHVDSRLLDYNDNFATKITNKSLYSLAYSNTVSESYNQGSYSLREDLLALIPANKSTALLNSTGDNATATHDFLFKTGDVFSMDKYSMFFNNGKLHDGSEIPYKITFDNVSLEEATITFEVI